MIETIAALLLVMGMGLLLVMAPLALLWLFYTRGLITREEAEQVLRDMAEGQVRLCGR